MEKQNEMVQVPFDQGRSGCKLSKRLLDPDGQGLVRINHIERETQMTQYYELKYLGGNRFGLPPQLDDDFVIIIGGLTMIPPEDYTYNELENTIKVTDMGERRLARMSLSIPTVKAYGMRLGVPKRKR